MFHPKSWQRASPGDKQIGWITRHNICLQEYFILRRKAERKKEKKKPTTLQDSSQSLNSDLALQMSNSLKVSEPSTGMFSEENSPASTLPLFGPKRQSLRCLWKVQEGVEGGKHHIFFSDNCEFPLLHLAFNFHQNKLFTKINVGYNQGPRSFYLWVQRLRNTGLRLHSLLPRGASHLIVGCFLLI